MVNRTAVIFRYREPMVRWINETDPSDTDPQITSEDLNREQTVYLISDEDGDGEPAVQNWVAANFEAVFEKELGGWYTEPDFWPKERTLALFREWFQVEYHTVIVDTVGGAIYDDEA